MQRTMKRIGALLLALAMLVTFMPALGLAEHAHADEAEELEKAVAALEDADPLEPVQWNSDYTAKQDTNINAVAQAIVDEEATGVEVTSALTSSSAARKAIAEDGTLTYPSRAATYSVTFTLETANDEDYVTVDVNMPKNKVVRAIYFAENTVDIENKIRESILGSNTSFEEIKSNLNISIGDYVDSDTYYNLIPITYDISDENVISTRGKVTRPGFGEEDADITIGVTVSYDGGMMEPYLGPEFIGDVPEPISFNIDLKVKAFTEEENAAAQEAVTNALNDFDVSAIKKNNGAGDAADLEDVRTNLYLPSVTGFTTKWTSSDSEALKAPTSGTGVATAYRPAYGEAAKKVRLVLSLTKDGYTGNRSFEVTLTPITNEERDDIDAEIDYVDRIANSLDFYVIQKDNTLNPVPGKVTGNLQMVYRGIIDDETGAVSWKTSNTGNTGAKIEWATSNSAVIKTYGTVTRPTGTTDTDVVMTATVTSQKYAAYVAPRKVEIPVTVLAADSLTDLNEPPQLSNSAVGSGYVTATDEYSMDASTIFTDPNGDVLTYKASIDGGEYEELITGIFKHTWGETGTHTIRFKANDGKADSEEYTLSLQVLESSQAHEAEELQNYKQQKCTDLENYKDPADYRRAQQKELADAVAAGKSAINAAADKGAVDDAYEEAVDDIDMITTSKDYAVIDLSDAIDEATAFANSMQTGSGVGKYPAAAKEALLAAIETAQAVYDDSAASYNDVLQAKADLDAAVATAKDAVNAVSISINILGQDKVNAYTKALYPATVKSDSAERYGYQKPAEYKHQVTAIDAMAVLHHEMYGSDFDSAPTNYLVMNSSGTITKIFGKSTINLGYYVNYEYPIYGDGSVDSTGAPLGSVAFDTVLTAGDQFNVWIYGTGMHKDRLLYFDKNNYSATTDGTIDVTLYGRQAGIVGSGEQKAIEGGVVIAADASGKEIASATTDALGKATLSIKEEGDFYLTAKSIPADPATNDDHFVAPYAEIRVTDILENAKRQAQNELTKLEEDSKDKVKDPEALAALIAKAKDDISKAADEEAVQKILSETKEAVKKMVEEKEAEQKDEQAYGDAAAAANAELDKIDVSGYSDADKAAVQKLIEDAKKEIADAKTASAVKAAMDKFNEAMKAFDSADVIKGLIADAIAEIDKTIDPAEYMKKDQAAVKQLVADAKAALEKASTRAEITAITQKLNEDVSAYKTQAQADKEAKAKAKKLKVKGLKIKSSKRRFKISWKKTRGAGGYQVQYKLKKAKKFKTLKNLTKTKMKSKKLKKGKKYSFRVRTYTKVAGKKVYGKWTKVKSVKCR